PVVGGWGWRIALQASEDKVGSGTPRAENLARRSMTASRPQKGRLRLLVVANGRGARDAQQTSRATASPARGGPSPNERPSGADVACLFPERGCSHVILPRPKRSPV